MVVTVINLNHLHEIEYAGMLKMNIRSESYGGVAANETC